MTLENLYDELGTMKWVGSDEGWDLAIEAVRKRIREEINKCKTIPPQTDKQKGKIKEVLEQIDVYCSCRRSPGINNTTGNCIGCGKKYDKPWMRTRIIPSFQACLLDNVPSGTITNVACSCPKCSPKC